MTRVKPLWRVLGTIFGVIWIAICLLPFYLMFMTSLKSNPDYGTNGFFSFPEVFHFENYWSVIQSGIYRFFINSVIIMAISLVLLITFSLMASYPLSRMRFRMNKPISSFVIACMAVPIHVTLIPVYLLTRNMGFYDTHIGLILPYIAFNMPITIFILINFMKTIPQDLEDAAGIDGCNKFTSFYRVIVPLTLPGIVTVSIYDAIAVWNEFSFALVLTQSESSRTMPLAVWNYKAQYGVNVPLLFCVLTLSVIPMIIAFAIGQDKLVKGMMAGALKG